jgi:hypothetical protein
MHVRQAGWFAEDGSVLGYVSRDHQLVLIDAATAKHTHFIGMTGSPTAEEPWWEYESAGFDRLILAKPRGSMYDHGSREFGVWDREGIMLRRFTGPNPNGLYRAVRLSHDGRTLAVQDNVSITLMETATSRPCGSIKIPSVLHAADFPKLVDFSPDGRLLAYSAPDRSILLWDLTRPLDGQKEVPAPADVDEAAKLWESSHLTGRAVQFV